MTATITYTSKRRHKPDVVGAELAPSMTYTNWTAGNSATLSNDTSGNLKVAYNAVSNPYAYKSFTVTSGAFYVIRGELVYDGSAQKAAIWVGPTTNGDNAQVYPIASTLTETVPFEIYVQASSTTLYLTMFCFVSSSGYALFNDVSIKQVTTLTHSSVQVLQHALSNTNGWTASSSTNSTVNIFSSSIDDNRAVAITNTGAAYGQSQKTYPFPSVSGRTYKASTLWIPHECAQSTLTIGTALGGSQTATTTMDADIDGTNPFFTAGTDDSGSALQWNFTNTDDSWVSTNITPTNNATYIALASTTTGPQFSRAGLSFSGYENRYVACSVRRTSASFTQNAALYYKTSAHGFSASYYASRGAATLLQVTAGSGAYTVIVWDMWQLQAGGTDWKDNTITDLRIDFTSTSGATWEVNWISVGNLNPLEITFDATQAYHYLTLQNSNESGAISYYVLPNATQQNSEYTLSTGISAADQEYPEDVREAISLDGTTETTFYREDENWTVTTTIISSNDDLADYLEFLSSCKAGETFTIDLYGDGDTKTAMLRPGASSIQRVSATKYRATIGYRVLD